MEKVGCMSVLVLRTFALFVIVAFLSVFVVGSSSGWEIIIDDPEQDDVIFGTYNVTGRVEQDMNDTGELAAVNISIDGGGEVFANEEGPGYYNWLYEWDTSSFGDGDHTLTAYVYVDYETGGGEGNGSGEEWFQEDYVVLDVEIDNKVPTAFIDSITPNSTVVGNVVTFEGHGQPPLGRTIVEYKWRSWPGDDDLSNKKSFSTSTLSVGIHTVRFEVWDSEGMGSDPVTMEIEITAPEEGNWPTFHGEFYRTGAVSDGPGEGNIMWNFSTDSGDTEFSDPVVYNGKVYIAESVITETSAFGVIHALDVNGTFDDAQGESFGRADLIWNFTLPKFALAAPSCRDGKVFVGTQWSASHPNFYALNAYNGAQLWTYTTNGHVWASPAVTSDMVVLTDFDGKVIALDPLDGDLLWRTDLEYPVLSSPLIAGGRIYVPSTDGMLHMLNAADGEWISSTDLGGGHTTAPVFHDDRVFFTARGDGSNDRLVARNRFDISDTGVGSWAFTPGGRIHTTPVATDDGLFIVTENGTVVCVDLDGNLEWTLDLNDTVLETPALGGSLLYVPSASGTLYAVDIDSETVEWTLDLPGELTSPAISGEYLFIGGDGYAYAIWETSIPSVEIANIEVALIPDVPETQAWYLFAVDYDPFTVSENITLEMTGNATDPGGLEIVGYEWTSSRDGHLGGAAAITIALEPGSHSIKFRARNEDDVWSSYATIPVVVNANERPTVSVDIEYPYVGEYTSFDLSGSNDTDGAIELYRIDFGDDSDIVFWSDSTRAVSHRYTSTGNYTMIVRAYDDHGLVNVPAYEKTVAITTRDTTDIPGSGSKEKDDSLDAIILIAAIGGVFALLAIIAFILFVGRPGKARKKDSMVEFEEDELKKAGPELDIDEKEEKLAEIASRLGEEKVLGAKAAPPRGRRKSPPKKKAPVKPKAKPAAKPKPKAKTPAKPKAKPDPVPEPEPEPEPEPSEEPEPAEPADEPEEVTKDLSEKRSSLEDLLADLESMRK